jgi:molybdate transport system ATP-binding protein
MAHAPQEDIAMSLVLKNISLPLSDFRLELGAEIRSPIITVIFGPSGSGKTSLLDLIAGLRRPESAFIELDEEVLTDTANDVFVPTRQRGIGYVPQDLALFPHLSVRQNLLYGHKPATTERFSFDHIVDLLEIRGLVERGIAQLSGGEKQRVALARALLASPRLLLLDEPLANLDMPLKMKILPYLARIRDEFGIPVLYVTHDRFETLSLADEIIILINGKIVQSGPTQDVYRQPATPYVRELLVPATFDPLTTPKYSK